MNNVYDPRKIKVFFNGSKIDGFSEDSNVTITPNGDGTKTQVGCDGEVMVSIDVDNTFTIKLSLMQTSESNDILSASYKNFRENGMLSRIYVKDDMGTTVFSSSKAAVKKYPETSFKKDGTAREWEIVTMQADEVNIGGEAGNQWNGIDYSKFIMY